MKNPGRFPRESVGRQAHIKAAMQDHRQLYTTQGTHVAGASVRDVADDASMVHIAASCIHGGLRVKYTDTSGRSAQLQGNPTELLVSRKIHPDCPVSNRQLACVPRCGL